MCAGLDEALRLGALKLELRRSHGGGSHLEWVGEEQGGEVRFTEEPRTSWWQRVKAWFFGVLPIEAQL